MALWKEQAAPATSTPSFGAAQPKEAERPAPVAATPTAEPARRADRASPKESIIAADLAIEGKIEGSGHVRIAGRFKGDVHVDGNLTVEQGAHLTGQVYAKMVTVAGELHGNIIGATRVELTETGVLAGDVKAGAITVAAGSRMRGHAEFGWEEKSVKAVS
jgi:cytoskeletal protein CcmA (bactofilin family)